MNKLDSQITDWPIMDHYYFQGIEIQVANHFLIRCLVPLSLGMEETR